MKIYRMGSGSPSPLTLEQAVTRVLTPDPYSYGGQLERVEEKTDLTAQFLSRLVTKLVEKELLNAEELQEVLGYGYEVTEDV